MGKEFSITPRAVARVETKYRRIVTALPHPDSVPTLEKLRQFEPQSMRGQPPLVWDRAEDMFVYDKYGNRWLDWSSGVLVTNAGHCAPEVRQAILDQVNSGLLHNYVFPSEERAALVEQLVQVAPKGLDKVFLLTTGSEATECAIKLARSHGIRKGGNKKIGIVGAERGFHGRTLGAQQAGGIPGQKGWIVNEDPAIVQVPFPDGYWTEDTSFDLFLATLAKKGLRPENVAGVMFETYQGVGPDFAPVEYIRQLAKWCKAHDALLIFDEVQAGFGRTGKFWAFEHYGVTPDVICCGKGISSSLPLSAVIGRAEIMDQFRAGLHDQHAHGQPGLLRRGDGQREEDRGGEPDRQRRAAGRDPGRGLAGHSAAPCGGDRPLQLPRAGRRPADDQAGQEGAEPRPGPRRHRALLPQRAAVLRAGGRLGADGEDRAAADDYRGSGARGPGGAGRGGG